LKFPEDIKALLSNFKKDEELGANFIVQPIDTDDDDDPTFEELSKTCMSQKDKTDLTHESFKPDYDTI